MPGNYWGRPRLPLSRPFYFFPPTRDLPGFPYNSRMDNKTVARVLRETAQLLEIDGAIIGRYRTYEKAAQLIGGLHERIEELAKDEAKLTELPGIGENMAAHIREILQTGDYTLRKKLLNKYPATILDLLTL